MLRLSVTQLDALRRFYDDEEATEAQIIEYLAGASPPTRPMLAGSAFARYWERASEGVVETAESDGWRFEFCLDERVPLTPFREIKAEMPIDTPSGRVMLVGRADGIVGRTVRDQKLVAHYEPERYLHSMQWRAYLLLFDVHRFDYDIFVAKIDDNEPVVNITEYFTLSCYRYPGMEDDVRHAVFELADFANRTLDKIRALNPTALMPKE